MGEDNTASAASRRRHRHHNHYTRSNKVGRIWLVPSSSLRRKLALKVVVVVRNTQHNCTNVCCWLCRKPAATTLAGLRAGNLGRSRKTGFPAGTNDLNHLRCQTPENINAFIFILVTRQQSSLKWPQNDYCCCCCCCRYLFGKFNCKDRQTNAVVVINFCHDCHTFGALSIERDSKIKSN